MGLLRPPGRGSSSAPPADSRAKNLRPHGPRPGVSPRLAKPPAHPGSRPLESDPRIAPSLLRRPSRSREPFACCTQAGKPRHTSLSLLGGCPPSNHVYKDFTERMMNGVPCAHPKHTHNTSIPRLSLLFLPLSYLSLPQLARPSQRFTKSNPRSFRRDPADRAPFTPFLSLSEKGSGGSVRRPCLLPFRFPNARPVPRSVPFLSFYHCTRAPSLPPLDRAPFSHLVGAAFLRPSAPSLSVFASCGGREPLLRFQGAAPVPSIEYPSFGALFHCPSSPDLVLSAASSSTPFVLPTREPVRGATVPAARVYLHPDPLTISRTLQFRIFAHVSLAWSPPQHGWGILR